MSTHQPGELPVVVAALYRFTRFEDPAAPKGPLAKTCCSHGVKGTLLLAREGINGTIAGSRAGIGAVLAHIRSLPGCADLEHKELLAQDMPFKRMKVRLKKEIVTLGDDATDPTKAVGTYVDAADWNALIADEDTLLIDTRNDFEVEMGTFAGAVNPKLSRFGAFCDYAARELDPGKHRKIAMFCTGGIRCEKASAYLLARGFTEVYHLKGGILRYLETVPESESRWTGACFVFDDRISVRHGLEPGAYGMCHACRMPVGETDRRSPLFEEGVSCHHCHASRTDEDRARYRERHRQVKLAEARGSRHVGS